MGASKDTGSLRLPIFEESDKPSWLMDWNQAMKTIQARDDEQTARINSVFGLIAQLQAEINTLKGNK